MSEILEKIKNACDFVNLKKDKNNSGPKVTCQVRWADWSKKWFSPAMSVLWHAVELESSSINNFAIPNSNIWIKKISNYLDVTEDWVNLFVEQCYLKNLKNSKTTVTISFDGLGPDPSGTYENMEFLNPKIIINNINNISEDILAESKYCIENYSNITIPKLYPYKNTTPINISEKRLLYEALEYFKILKNI